MRCDNLFVCSILLDLISTKKNCFVKEKGKKKALYLSGCAGKQKGNGINSI